MSPLTDVRPRVHIFLREFVGGVTSMMVNWAELAGKEAETSFVLARDTSRPFTSLDGMLPSPSHRVTFDGRFDNRRLVYERSAARIGSPADHLVANDVLELGMISSLRLPNPVSFVLHGDQEYYYGLATRHAAQIGSFLCPSMYIEQRLKERLPQRLADIHLAHPIVPEPQRTRATPLPGTPLRLLFVGRLTEEKGFFDLRRIDSALAAAGIAVSWTVVALAINQLPKDDKAWLVSEHVTHLEIVSLRDMESVYPAHDILIFPSRCEAFGMSVLEAMKCGLVPIASRLEAGIPEMIDDGVSGFTLAVGDWGSMAARIGLLAKEPARLEAMGAAARRTSLERFDGQRAVERLTSAILAARPRPVTGHIATAYLSRLDRRWLPNSLVRTARKVLRSQREKDTLDE